MDVVCAASYVPFVSVFDLVQYTILELAFEFLRNVEYNRER
jgi:hypothetical protein